MRELLETISAQRDQDADTRIKGDGQQLHHLSGTLVIADSTKKQIKVMDNQGKKIGPIHVPDGMRDIVRSLWEEPVIIDCILVGGYLQLEHIIPANR